jgi:hypothetical protein
VTEKEGLHIGRCTVCSEVSYWTQLDAILWFVMDQKFKSADESMGSIDLKATLLLLTSHVRPLLITVHRGIHSALAICRDVRCATCWESNAYMMGYKVL